MTALCTHGVQTGAGYSCSACVTTPASLVPVVIDGSGVPEVEQELPAIISHDADGFTVVDRERLAAFDAELARQAARLEADRVANLPVTPAEERTEKKGSRTFAIPACPDDLVRVADVEGEVWTRGERSRRNRWTSADGLEIVDWHRLVVSYGPVEES